MDYNTQLQLKIERIRLFLSQFKDLSPTTICYDQRRYLNSYDNHTFNNSLYVIPSEENYYRYRCRYQIICSKLTRCNNSIIDDDDDDNVIHPNLSQPKESIELSIQPSVRLKYTLWKEGEPKIDASEDNAPSKIIRFLMPNILQYCENIPILYENLEAISFLSTLSGQVLISMIYSKTLLEQEWKESATLLQHHISNKLTSDFDSNLMNLKTNINITGRSKGLKIVIGNDFVWEILPLIIPVHRSIHLKQSLDGFSSPNALVNVKALDWICYHISKITDHIHSISKECHDIPASTSTTTSETTTETIGINLLELYCGNGNHTMALSSMVNHIIAIELNSVLCKMANENLIANGSVKNVDIVHVDSQAFARNLLKNRCYQTVGGKKYEFQIVLVDPPRVGLDVFTRSLVCSYEYIIYISCNPNALVGDLSTICLSHDIIAIALFDQFPFTNHIESGLILKKRQ